MTEKKKRKKTKSKSPKALAEEALRVKALELWDDPERELDEYDLKLARLQGEMDDEDEAKEAARTAEARKRKEAAEKRAAKAAAEADEKAEGTPSSRPAKDSDEGDDDEVASGDEVSSDGTTSDRVAEAVTASKKKVEAETRDAAGEVAGEAMRSGKGIGDAALTVVKRRLPSLPSKEKVRNLALGVGGAGIGMWLAWGLIAPVFAWAWWLTKWGIVGALGYTAFTAYGALPSSDGTGAPDTGAEEGNDEVEDDEE